MSEPSIVVLDGTAMLFRAYHGQRHARSSGGTPLADDIAALAGVCRELVDIFGRARSRHVVVVFDTGRPGFRHRLDTRYKASRPEPSPQLRSQRDALPSLIASLGFRTLMVNDFEADDLMATVATMARNQGMPCWLVSPDKDLFQLVDDSPPAVRGFHSRPRRIIDQAEVVARIGVPPVLATTYFALTGDSSDSVPGVPGVGPLAARALVNGLGDLAAIYSQLDAVAGLPIRGARTLGARLVAGRAEAELALQLVTLRRDVPLPTVLAPLRTWARWRGPRPDAHAHVADLGIPSPVLALSNIARG